MLKWKFRIDIKLKSTSRFDSIRLCRKYLVNVLCLFFFKGRDDLESFQLEISGFLKEMACPYSVLISGDIKDRLKKKDDCLKLLCKLHFFEQFKCLCLIWFVLFSSQDLWTIINEALDILYIRKVLIFGLKCETDSDICITVG